MPPWANKEHTMPSSSKLWRALLGLGILGLLVSLYLLWIKFNPADPFCAGVGDCEAVNSSIYSTVRGIPVALFGVLAYAALVASLLLEKRSPFFAANSPLFIFGLTLAGTLYSAYLTYIELFVIHQVCPYCVISALAITAMLVLSSIRMKQHPAE